VIRRVTARIREFLTSRHVDRDLTEELQSHLDHLTDDYVRRGMNRDDARRRAVRDFGGAGGVEIARESVRDARGLPWLEQLAIDARRGVRTLAKTRGFTVVTILTLALGIGASTAIYSLVDHVVLRPLPYPDQDRLVSIWEASTVPPRLAASSSSMLTSTDDPNRQTVAPASYMDFRKVAAFASLAGYDRQSMTLTGAGSPEQVLGETITAGYFDVLGAAPEKGRLFGSLDEQADSPKTVIVSHGLWQRRFAGDPDIVGKSITLNNQSLEVVGVMPVDFAPISQFVQPDPIGFWVTQAFRADLLGNYADHEIFVVGRLKPGVSIAQAQAQLTAASLDIAQRAPQSNLNMRAYLRPLGDDLVRRVRTSLIVISLMVGFILLIACVNVANLLIVRGAGRRRDIAIRYALGASRRRVLSEMIVESLILAAASCAAGLVIAWWLKDVLVSLAPSSLPRLGSVAIDGRVLLFSVGLSIATGLIFGALPAWQARRARPIDAMGTGNRVVAARWVMRWRNALLVFEIAMSTVLLIGAGLMVRSLTALNRVDLGFRTDQVLAMSVTLPDAKYPTGDSRAAFFDRLEAQLRQLPGVASVAFANRMPMRGSWDSGFAIDGGDGRMVSAGFQAVNPGFFSTLDIHVVRGRLLTTGDVKGSEPVAVVSEAFGQKLLNGADPIGRRFRRSAGGASITIVGVVRDIRRDGKRADIDPQVFLAAAQTTLYPTRLADVAVRLREGRSDGVAIRDEMRAAVAAVDPAQPIANVRGLDEVVSLGSRDQRFQAVLFGVFAALALLLAVIGVHGVVSYLVAQRSSEIAVRMALGAGRWTIAYWLLAATTWRVVAGAVIGLAGASLLSGFVRTLLFQVTPLDTATYALAALLLTSVAIGAAAIATRRAMRIDPVRALRSE